MDKLPVIQEDKPKISNPGRFKHGQKADLPAQCDDCRFGQNPDIGGNGLCKKYEAGATCIIRKDLAEYYDKFDTRDIEEIRELLDHEIKFMAENLRFYTYATNLAGNNPSDKQVRSLNAYVKLLSLQVNLMDKIETTHVKSDSDKQALMSIFATKGVAQAPKQLVESNATK